MDIDREIAALRQQYQKDTNVRPDVGILGKSSDESGEITDKDVPGNVWVREWTGNGYSLPKSILNALPDGTHLYAGMGVEIGWKRNERAVIDKDRKSGGDNPVRLPQQYTSQQSITTLLVKPTNPSSLKVQVLGGRFTVGLTTYELPTTDETEFPHVNLTSLVPASGNHCYAVIYLKSDYASYEAKASTAQSELLPLDETDLAEAHASKTPFSSEIWAVRLYGDQATAENDDVYVQGRDLRTFFKVADTDTRTVSTTNATVTTLATYTLPSSTTYGVEAIVVARRTGGSSGTAEDGARYKLSAVYKNVAGTATIIGSVHQEQVDEDQAGWDATLDVTGATVRVRVTGAANNNIDWKVITRVFQVS